MKNRGANHQGGFTVVEAAIVVLLIGAIMAFATPKILNAMREHRLSMAVREVADQIQRAKAQAMSDNKTSSLMVDTANSRIGLAIKDGSGTITGATYIPLPQGVIFQMPESVTAPLAGAPTSGAVSFPPYGTSTTEFQQDFTSRGFPSVAPGMLNAVYLTNGRNYRAITLNSVGSIRTWWWEGGTWVSAR